MIRFYEFVNDLYDHNILCYLQSFISNFQPNYCAVDPTPAWKTNSHTLIKEITYNFVMAVYNVCP